MVDISENASVQVQTVQKSDAEKMKDIYEGKYQHNTEQNQTKTLNIDGKTVRINASGEVINSDGMVVAPDLQTYVQKVKADKDDSVELGIIKSENSKLEENVASEVIAPPVLEKVIEEVGEQLEEPELPKKELDNYDILGTEEGNFVGAFFNLAEQNTLSLEPQSSDLPSDAVVSAGGVATTSESERKNILKDAKETALSANARLALNAMGTSSQGVLAREELEQSSADKVLADSLNDDVSVNITDADKLLDDTKEKVSISEQNQDGNASIQRGGGAQNTSEVANQALSDATLARENLTPEAQRALRAMPQLQYNQLQQKNVQNLANTADATNKTTIDQRLLDVLVGKKDKEQNTHGNK